MTSEINLVILLKNLGDGMRFIEYSIETFPNEFSPNVILLDCEDISTFVQLPGEIDRCKLITKQKNEYVVYGTYKTVTNRFFYAITKKHNFHEDDIMRPSIRVFYRPDLLEIDTSFFDKAQLKGFIYGLIPDFNLNLLPEYTKEIFEKENN